MSYTFEDVFEELSGLVYWLAKEKEQPHVVLMDSDELVGELLEEVVKVYQHYEDKRKSKDEMVKLIKRALSNRIGELMYRYFLTHRKLGNDPVDVDTLAEYDDDENALSLVPSSIILSAHIHTNNPENLFNSNERVRAVRSKLTVAAGKVFDAVIYGNDLLELNMELAGERATAVYSPNSKIEVKLRPWYIADSLGMDLEDVMSAIGEIKFVYNHIVSNIDWRVVNE